MNVVIVDGDVSYPASSGKRLRTLNLMLGMARRHRLTYLARGNGDPHESRMAREYLGAHGIKALIVEDPLPRKSGLGLLARLAANVLSPHPFSVSTHNRRRMRAALAAHARASNVDLWQFEWPAYLLALPATAGGATLLNAHNVDALIWQRYTETEPHPLRRWYLRQQWHRFDRFERRMFNKVDRVIAVSEADAAIIRAHYGMDRVDVVDNGIDCAYYRAARGPELANTILFLGSLDWRPNLDGARVLLSEIFPAVRRQAPEARLCIVGRKAPPWLVQQAAAQPGVELHADVPDVRPYLAGSVVMAVPLRIGGGSRLKILEALACGLPVVSTRVGAEGLSVQPGVHFVEANTPAEQASALVQALRQPGPLRAMAEQGRRLVVDRYDWDILADKLDLAWQKCVQGQKTPHLVAQA